MAYVDLSIAQGVKYLVYEEMDCTHGPPEGKPLVYCNISLKCHLARDLIVMAEE